METYEKVLKYFNGKEIGSILFVKQGWLTMDDINDIDILIDGSTLKNVREFLEDEGYKETQKPIILKGYSDTEGSLEFKKPESFHPIHICIKSKENQEVYSLKKLFAEKFERGTDSDLMQLKKIIENKLGI
jgi:hypothetical protein